MKTVYPAFDCIQKIYENLPEGIPCVFISAATGDGIQELKDILWGALNSEENRLAAVKRDELVHRDYDRRMLAADFADWEADYEDGFEVDDDEDLGYDEYDFDEFLTRLQKILPDDEAFVYMEAGNEKLRYVVGFVVVVTSKEIKSMSLDTWAKEQAKQLLGSDFETETEY